MLETVYMTIKQVNLQKIKYVHASWGYDRNIYKNKKNIIKLNHFKDISKFI